jgi:hydroxymethylglutaryl-CoA lyase
LASVSVRPTQVKVEILERLADAGVPWVTATAIGDGDDGEPIPQVEDALTVLERLGARDGTVWAAAVSSLDGARRAVDAGAGGLAVTIPATAGCAERFLGREIGTTERRAEEVVDFAVDSRVPVAVTVAVAFGCPVEGEVPEEWAVELAGRWLGLGAARVTLDDSAGLAHPLQVARLAGAVAESTVAFRLSDSRGLGLANALAALQNGVTCLAGSIAGVGGSLVEPGAPGPVATEDLAYLCDELDIDTGIDWKVLRKAGRRVLEVMARSLPARTLFIEPRRSVYERLG